MTKIFDVVKPGVLVGEDVNKVFEVAKQNNFCIASSKCSWHKFY
jgi:fructose-bisphosphate aldolase class II